MGMINQVQLLRNVGQFDSVDAGRALPLAKLTLVYADNGRGKTTLAAILRSLATGDPLPIAERRRLAAVHPPHVVVECIGGPPAAIFQNGAWNRSLGDMAVFDDAFVDRNLYSGLAVAPQHRQNLHELILGAQGIALNAKLRKLADESEALNGPLRSAAAAIPKHERSPFDIDEFCALPPQPGVDAAIQQAERGLAAVRDIAAIHRTERFGPLRLPEFDAGGIDELLKSRLATIEQTAISRVQAHFSKLGRGGEAWVAEGVQRTRVLSGETSSCPFCAQDLAGAQLIEHYRAFFSQEYAQLKGQLDEMLRQVFEAHGGDSAAGFERAVRTAAERCQFWTRFCDVPEFRIDTEAISATWRVARDEVQRALHAKAATPLEPVELSDAAREALRVYEESRRTVAALDAQLQQANRAVDSVKANAAAGNEARFTVEIGRLKAIRARHATEMDALCRAYIDAKAAKAAKERERDEVRDELDRYRSAVFPACENAVNAYLEKFGAGFRLERIAPINARGGPICNYDVVINGTAVPVAGGEPTAGQPSFRNTLSAGDRNTLALAFFFASLDQDTSNLGTKIVVIDDPVSSLDDHRALTTVEEIHRLTGRAGQVLVLSHDKVFLSRLWELTDRSVRTAIEVARDGNGSTLRTWNVDLDCVTAHDRRHALLRAYVERSSPNNREVAQALRPVLEAFLRVAFPADFPPGTQLGTFRDKCHRQCGTAQEILRADDAEELRYLILYANQFHHDTNPLGWETVAINDGQLLGYVKRILKFAKRV